MFAWRKTWVAGMLVEQQYDGKELEKGGAVREGGERGATYGCVG